jgi:hypothetical protein
MKSLCFSPGEGFVKAQQGLGIGIGVLGAPGVFVKFETYDAMTADHSIKAVFC